MVRIVVLVNYYVPGTKGGGQIVSVYNLVSALCDRFRFAVLTSDRDHGDELPFSCEAIHNAFPPGSETVYLPPGVRGAFKMLRVLLFNGKDIVYLNSVFDRRFTVLPLFLRRVGVMRGCKIVVAPRGELSEGALSIKGGRKRWFLAAAAWGGLYKGVVWHVSSNYEEEEVRRASAKWGLGGGRVYVASDLVGGFSSPNSARTSKRKGSLRILFLSRITRKKNLLYALGCLARLRGEISMIVYGPIEDSTYWDECCKAIVEMPEKHRGEIPWCRSA